MFPLNDFNIVCAALATVSTVSAAVGYNVHRRRRSSSLQARIGEKEKTLPLRSSSVFSTYSDSCASYSTLDSDVSMTEPMDLPTPSDLSTSAVEDTRPVSLKRKNRDDDDEPQDHVDVSQSARTGSAPAPSKRRCLTPSASDETEPYMRAGYSEPPAAVAAEAILVDESIAAPASPSIAQDQAVERQESAVIAEEQASVAPAAASEASQSAEPLPCSDATSTSSADAATVVSTMQDSPVETSQDTSTENPHNDEAPVEAKEGSVEVETAVKEVPAAPTKKQQPLEQTKPTIFRAMQPITPAKASSAFKAFASSPSAFASTSASPGGRPVWASSITVDIFSPNDKPASTLGDREEGEIAEGSTQTGSEDESERVWRPRTRSGEDPLAASARAKSTHTTITGEEDEEVVTEIKGAKLYTMRGAGEFSSGTIGHAKILKHRETGDERILFRRDLVWKVAMNVKLSQAVRCAFNKTSGELRFVLKEAGGVAVYAMKRGSAPKECFAKFAERVVAIMHPELEKAESEAEAEVETAAV